MITTTLRGGTARNKISPPPGIYLMGYGNRVQGNLGVHDELYVTTLVVDDGATRAALLTVDHAFLHPTVVDQLKMRLPDIAAEALFVCCSHTHAGPIGYADARSRPTDRDYMRFLVDQLVASVHQASDRLEPVTLLMGTDQASININRRERQPDGQIIIGNNPEGPVDHLVQVLQLRSRTTNHLLATLVNYACHPVVMGPQNRLASADWVGGMRRGVEAMFGGYCLFVQGATADVNPRQMHWAVDNWVELEAQGAQVAAAVKRAADKMLPLPAGPIEGRQSICWLPLETAPANYDLLRVWLAAGPTDDAIRAALFSVFPWQVTVEMRYGIPHSPLSTGVLRIGDWALAALGTEPFTETGFALRAASPAHVTFVAGYTNGCNSYLPVRSSYGEGGYELSSAPMFYGLPAGFASGGAERVVAEVLRLFNTTGQSSN